MTVFLFSYHHHPLPPHLAVVAMQCGHGMVVVVAAVVAGEVVMVVAAEKPTLPRVRLVWDSMRSKLKLMVICWLEEIVECVRWSEVHNYWGGLVCWDTQAVWLVSTMLDCWFHCWESEGHQPMLSTMQACNCITALHSTKTLWLHWPLDTKNFYWPVWQQ